MACRWEQKKSLILVGFWGNPCTLTCDWLEGFTPGIAMRMGNHEPSKGTKPTKLFMTNTGKKQEPISDDIDLLLLVERALVFFKKFKWIFIIAIISGVGVGIWKHRSAPKMYKSRMIVHSFMLTNQEEIGIVSNWNELLKKGEYASLASIFNCREAILHHVKEIKAEELQKVFTPTNPNGFHIEVSVTDNSVLKELQDGIVYGFENTPFVQEKMAVKKANFVELINITAVEIRKLDSTKRNVEGILSGNGRGSSSIILDASGINRQLIEMNEKLLNFKQELKFAGAVQVLQNFSAFSKPSGPRLIVSLFIWILVFLSIAYIYALVHSVNEKLKDRARLRNAPSTI
jgi:hypothetical protein